MRSYSQVLGSRTSAYLFRRHNTIYNPSLPLRWAPTPSPSQSRIPEPLLCVVGHLCCTYQLISSFQLPSHPGVIVLTKKTSSESLSWQLVSAEQVFQSTYYWLKPIPPFFTMSCHHPNSKTLDPCLWKQSLELKCSSFTILASNTVNKRVSMKE